MIDCKRKLQKKLAKIYAGEEPKLSRALNILDVTLKILLKGPFFLLKFN